MKLHLVATGFASLCVLHTLHAGGTFACGGKVEIVRENKPVPISSGHSARFMEDLQMLLQSCSVDSTKEAASPQKWDEVMQSPSRIHYKAPAGYSFRLSLTGKISADVSELLLPLPEDRRPDHLYVKNKAGIFSYTKYRPEFLKKIIEYPEINLASRSAYASRGVQKEK